MRRIRIEVGDSRVLGELKDTDTARSIWDALPLCGAANTWGDEIYFPIPVELQQAGDAQAVVSLGDLGYWPPGQALCIFFGPTPNSSEKEIRPASPVNVFGHIMGYATVLKQVRGGQQVTITRLC